MTTYNNKNSLLRHLPHGSKHNHMGKKKVVHFSNYKIIHYITSETIHKEQAIHLLPSPILVSQAGVLPFILSSLHKQIQVYMYFFNGNITLQFTLFYP